MNADILLKIRKCSICKQPCLVMVSHPIDARVICSICEVVEGEYVD